MDTVVVCVYKTGGDFDWRYVSMLHDSVMANGGHDFVCLTDDFSLSSVCEILPLVDDLPGWWSKIELFKLTYGQYVYFDLDTVIHKDISLFLNHPHNFTMLRDFNKKAGVRPASGVMAWNGDYSYLYESFDKSMIRQYNPIMGGKLGDQAYISDYLGFEPAYVQDLFPGLVSSHKWDEEVTRKKTPVVCYHGKPRPHNTGWSI